MRTTNSFWGLVAIVCAAACTTANAGIDKSTVEAGRLHVKGKLDASQNLIVCIDRDEKPLEWR